MACLEMVVLTTEEAAGWLRDSDASWREVGGGDALEDETDESTLLLDSMLACVGRWR
jgi:hypothetical protein